MRSLGFENLDEATGRKLLALLDRGAFPALTALTPSASKGRLPSAAVTMNIGAEDDLVLQCAALRRLPDMPSLSLQNTGALNAAWGPFTQLLLDGGLINLK